MTSGFCESAQNEYAGEFSDSLRMTQNPMTCPRLAAFLMLASLAVVAQVTPSAQAPVSYASVTELNVILTQVEQTSQSAQVDLARLRVERWKADSGFKRQAQANVDSLMRNMKAALPEVIAQLRAAPEDLSATFKLYRNLDALYDVLGPVVESTGAFASRDEYDSLTSDLGGFEKARRSLAERLEILSSAKEAELTRLRTELRAAQAVSPAPPKKIVVDDNEPPKKPAKKKTAPKPATTPSPATPPAKQDTKPQQ